MTKTKCKLCPICLTAEYELIRTCELQGGRFHECEANNLSLRVRDEDVVIDWRELRTTGASK